MIHRYIMVLGVFIHLLCCEGTAQEAPYFVEKLTTTDGLSSNTINDLVQDDNGFLWIATTDGLNRFDGTDVKQYFHIDSSNSLSHNYVLCLKKLPDNYIAIGTQAGLDFYNSNSGMFENFYYNQNRLLGEFNNTIVAFEMDTQGNLWAASRACIFIFDTTRKLKKVITSPFTDADAASKRLRFVEKMLPLSSGNMLLYLASGLHFYSSQTGKTTAISNAAYTGKLDRLIDLESAATRKKYPGYFPAASIFKIFTSYFLIVKPGIDSLILLDENAQPAGGCFFPFNKYPYLSWSQQISILDSTRLLLLFHNYGLAMLPVTWHNNKPSIHTPAALMFENHEYNTALCDREGNWWLATTEDGLQKISPNKQFFKSTILINQESGKPVKYEMTALTRYKNVLWIGTYGNGFFEWNITTGQQQQHRLTGNTGDPWPDLIWNVRQVTTDTLWVGTQAGMFWYSLAKKNQGRIPAYPGKPPVLDSVAITTQFIDSRGWVWMGLGKGNGVCYFDGKARRFKHYPANTIGGYPLRYPTSITEDKKGNLWLVNDASSSLVFWDQRTENFTTVPLQVSAKQPLGNLSGIWCQDDSTLWLGALTSGLLKFQPGTGSTKLFGHERGLSNSHITSIYEDKKKRLWLVTDGELSCFDQLTGMFTNYTVTEGLPVKHPTASFYYDEQDKRIYTGGRGAFFYFDPDMINPGRPPQKTFITALFVNGNQYMRGQDKVIKFKAWQNNISIQYAAIDLTNGPGTQYAYKLGGEDEDWVLAGNQRQINFSRMAPGDYTFMVRAASRNGSWSTEPASIHFYIRPPFTKTAWFYGLILLLVGAVLYTFYRFRLNQLKRTEQMRGEISRNLHDEVGSSLTNISLGSLLAQKQLHNTSAVQKILDRIYHDSQNVSESMREIVWSINPSIDTVGEALPRMLRYASELLEAKNIELKVEMTPNIEKVKLTMQERRDLYLIFKEAVNNLAKYSKATEVMIHFQLAGNTLNMLIADNGVGFEGNPPLNSNGLKNMQERAQRHRWDLIIQSSPGAGTTIALKAQIA